MGQGCGEGNPGGTAELDEDLLMEEEWLVALKGALAPRPLQLGEAGSRPKDRQRATKALKGRPRPGRARRSQSQPRRRGQQPPPEQGPPPRGPLPGGSLTALAARGPGRGRDPSSGGAAGESDSANAGEGAVVRAR